MTRVNKISFSFIEFESDDELESTDLELLKAAREAASHAYAPYSQFKVGAAVRLESGFIVTGANIENAAFPSGICAERNALSTVASNHPDDKPIAIAIAAITKSGITDEPVSPCGNCRQVIAEEEFRNCKAIKVILGGKNKTRIIEKGEYLLPLQFNRNNLSFTRH